MLNELFDAARSLDGARIQRANWHKEYVPVRSPKLAFFIYIDPQGEIADIDRIEKSEDVAELRTWESKGDLRQSFPYFNIPPLLWIAFNSKKNEHDKAFKKAIDSGKLTCDGLASFLAKIEKDETTKRWQEKPCNKLQSCLDKGKVLKDKLGDAPADCTAIIALIDRLQHASADKLYNKLCAAFTKKIYAHPKEAGKYFDGLFYSGTEEPKNIVTVFLELSDGASSFQFPIKHAHIRDWINDRLRSRSEVNDAASSESDAFGNDDAGWEATFDDIRMKNALGIVKLRAMAGAAKCQYRYGDADTDSCHVGQTSRGAMKGALEWLTDPVRKGITWATVSHVRASAKRASANGEILLAYPSVLPPDPPDVALMFGGSTESEADNTSRFEDCARNVTGTIRGLMAQNPDLDIRVFVLRKMDAARTRVSSHRRYSAPHFIRSAETWHIGCRNIPWILIRLFGKQGKPEWHEPQTPFPMEVVWTLNTLWARDGKSAGRVKAVPTETGITLLMEEGPLLRSVLDEALYIATRNPIGLILAIGQAHAQGHAVETEKRYSRQAQRQALILPDILGLLLFKLSIPKEDYMKSAPFLIGRLLNLADQLHYHYCQHVRDGSVPPQLMGNALMATALEEPEKALALYSNRILPYQAWAKTIAGDPAGLARYFLSELGGVCSELSSSAIPARCADADKAQILIGYLARPEKSDNETTQQGG